EQFDARVLLEGGTEVVEGCFAGRGLFTRGGGVPDEEDHQRDNGSDAFHGVCSISVEKVGGANRNPSAISAKMVAWCPDNPRLPTGMNPLPFFPGYLTMFPRSSALRLSRDKKPPPRSENSVLRPCR